MKICRFQSGERTVLGVLEGDWLYNLTDVDPGRFADLSSAYAESASDVAAMVRRFESVRGKAARTRFDSALLRIPVVEPEIWAAGVTYLRSKVARETETKAKGIYDRVYDAARPEIFLKDTGTRCRGPGEEICIRSDSKWSVPEPELTVVFDAQARVVGYTIGNDVSSRDIEGDNPLYLPQAKVYRGSAAIGPVIVTPDELSTPNHLEIRMKIFRDRREIFSGGVNTSQMKRSVAEMSEFLARDNVLRTFTLLMTGTSIVPPDDFTLRQGDAVEIEIDGIGLLRNSVVQL